MKILNYDILSQNYRSICDKIVIKADQAVIMTLKSMFTYSNYDVLHYENIIL